MNLKPFLPRVIISNETTESHSDIVTSESVISIHNGYSEKSYEMSTRSSLFYFVIFKEGQLRIFDSSFNLIQRPLNGLYSFIYFSELLILGYLVDYGSQHGGLNAMVQTLRLFTTKFRNHLFANDPKEFKLPYGDPIAGGGILFYKGTVIFWHLKSGSYSLENINCHDNRPPQLRTLIHSLGLPADRFINIKQAEYFEIYALREYFDTQGQYQKEPHLEQVINEICSKLNLLPIASSTQSTSQDHYTAEYR